ncbi:hypothetical protein BDV96DRAFT_610437 [Lophiotrema nucula]|uniref:DUF6594 domain-containing protein n=1 Tax=Lophiotrema nucula TaxID=690887 RepID=A0A6A5ZII6_9PLEO|nr:hypothetical protein BDV96DRAFT_610437 [Lophiotrema nucula]
MGRETCQKSDPEKAQSERKDEWTDGEDPDHPGGPLHDLVIGYPRLAGHMGAIPQTACFRRFGALNTRNLLYLQCELMFLEDKLKEAEKEDSLNDKGKKKRYAVNHLWLLRSDRDGDTTQLDLVREIRAKLKEYNEALIQQHTIMQMKEPDPYDIDGIQCFMSNPIMGPRALIGPDCFVWGCYQNKQGFSPELVCLSPKQSADTFTYWLGARSITLLEACGLGKFLKVSRKSGLKSIPLQTVFTLTFWLTSIIASLIPILSIAVLISVHSTKARLGTIAAFNILISVCLTVLTDARRTDVFAVTAA